MAESVRGPGAVITSIEVADIRFPTSVALDGSDAMNPDPDYSVAYVILRTDAADGSAGSRVEGGGVAGSGVEGSGVEGHGFTFTCGRGTEVVVACIEAMKPLVLGTPVERLRTDMGGFARSLVADSQLRWLGPEKGVTALATGAIVNAAWDLWAKLEGKPVWELLVGLSPQQVVDLVDFRYIEDAITPDEALALLTAAEPGKAARTAALREQGPKAYTTSAGWLGYTDEKMVALLREAIDEGFDHLKLKVGADLEDDVRRCSLARSVVGDERRLMIDANQVWGVDEAVAWLNRLKEFDLWWIEEPTSPDDILGHATIARAVAPLRVATGEHVQNRVMFKQLLQAGAISICQIDACRVAGVNEVVAILLMAAKAGVVVCPHAGGVGLCELVVHLAAFDAIAVAGDSPDRVVEFVDHLHEHFAEPTVVREGFYMLPTEPGYTTMLAESRRRFAFPGGPEWTTGGAA